MSKTADITHDAAGPIDGSGRERSAEWRVRVPGWATSYFSHDGSETGKRAAHARAVAAAGHMMTSDPRAT